MKSKLRDFFKNLSHGRLSFIFSFLYKIAIFIVYYFLRLKWFLLGAKKPDQEEVGLVKENVTFVFKSFERQAMAKRLYKCIQSYYPGVRVIIADDSSKPLDLQGENLEVIQLPFNSGLSYGLNCALEKVETPFMIRMDDDELLTPFTKWGKQLLFLMEHPEVDLVAVHLFDIPIMKTLEEESKRYYGNSMAEAPKELKIPHMTLLDSEHIVLGKTPNTFIVRTDKMKEVGYDNRIRMIDHDDFFYRAAGNMVSVLDRTAFVIHYHNRFDMKYQKYRADVDADRVYISHRRCTDYLQKDRKQYP